jgi:poly-D-alanine transfer protein DltD
MAEGKSIAELEQILAQQTKRLRELQAAAQERKNRLLSEIARVNEQIASISRETEAPKKTEGPKKTEAPKRAAAPRKTRRPIPRKKRPNALPQQIINVLKASPKPLSAAEIEEAVKKAGYQSSSKNFVGLVRRTCYLNKQIYAKERGRFAIKGKK